jgi:hypothetical protein
MESPYNLLFGSKDTFKTVKLADCKIKTTKHEQKTIPFITIGTKNEIVKNRFSGEECELSPEAVALYDICLGAELRANIKFERKIDNGDEVAICDAAKDIFLRNWIKEYYILLD